jgi:hypothetical protein
MNFLWKKKNVYVDQMGKLDYIEWVFMVFYGKNGENERFWVSKGEK